MAEEPLTLGRTIDHLRGRNSDPATVSAAGMITIGLKALTSSGDPLPADLLREWQRGLQSLVTAA